MKLKRNNKTFVMNYKFISKFINSSYFEKSNNNKNNNKEIKKYN